MLLCSDSVVTRLLYIAIYSRCIHVQVDTTSVHTSTCALSANNGQSLLGDNGQLQFRVLSIQLYWFCIQGLRSPDLIHVYRDYVPLI